MDFSHILYAIPLAFLMEKVLIYKIPSVESHRRIRGHQARGLLRWKEEMFEVLLRKGE